VPPLAAGAADCAAHLCLDLALFKLSFLGVGVGDESSSILLLSPYDVLREGDVFCGGVIVNGSIF